MLSERISFQNSKTVMQILSQLVHITFTYINENCFVITEKYGDNQDVPETSHMKFAKTQIKL